MSKKKTKHKRVFTTQLILECPSCKAETQIVKREGDRFLICSKCKREFGQLAPSKGVTINNKRKF